MAWHDRLKFRQADSVEETAVTDYPIESEAVEADRQSWLMMATLAIAALAFVVLVAVLANWLYHRSHKATQTPVAVRPGETLTVKKPGATPVIKAPTKTGVSSGGTSNTSSNISGKTAGKSTTPTGGNGSAQLPNSGPGDVVAIFIGATALASLFHYTLTIRRLNG